MQKNQQNLPGYKNSRRDPYQLIVSVHRVFQFSDTARLAVAHQILHLTLQCGDTLAVWFVGTLVFAVHGGTITSCA